MKRTYGLVALLGLSAAVGSAGIITQIDTFNTTVQAISNPSSAPCAGPFSAPTAAAPEAAGGYRTITAGGNTGGCATADTNFTFSGGYAASLPGGTAGLFTVIWNGRDASNVQQNAIDADFLTGFTFRARQDADVPPNEVSTVQFRICTNSDGTGTCTDSTIASISNQTLTNYSVSLGGGPFSDINYIRMTVSGGLERDVFIDFVNADIPEPGTLVLAGAALLGLALLRSRV